MLIFIKLRFISEFFFKNEGFQKRSFKKKIDRNDIVLRFLKVQYECFVFSKNEKKILKTFNNLFINLYIYTREELYFIDKDLSIKFLKVMNDLLRNIVELQCFSPSM